MVASKVEAYIQSIHVSFDNIIKILEERSNKEILWNPSNNEWSIIQIVSHLNEATPYWLGEVERVIDNPGAQWGRGLQDSTRLAAVEKPDALSMNEEFANLKKLKQQVSKRLSNLTDSQLNEENPHRNFEKFGKKPVSFIIEHFIDEHTAKHYGQIQRNLSKLKKQEKGM